jgi:LPXTG-site transpeptidase (sortase) family protein
MSRLYNKPYEHRPSMFSQLPWLKIGINTLIMGGLAYLVVSFYPVWSAELNYQVKQWANRDRQTVTATTEATPAAQQPVEGPALLQTPVNTDFSIISDKIDLNTPVVADVNPGNKKEYLSALNNGAAHALGTVKPGEVGNSYVFAHSTANVLNIEKYAAVFTLLNKLEPGDRITAFYAGKRFDYQVDRKYIVEFTDISPLIATYDHPVLTLQTCDPPGTEFKRLIITASLVGSYVK